MELKTKEILYKFDNVKFKNFQNDSLLKIFQFFYMLKFC